MFGNLYCYHFYKGIHRFESEMDDETLSFDTLEEVEEFLLDRYGWYMQADYTKCKVKRIKAKAIAYRIKVTLYKHDKKIDRRCFYVSVSYIN